jgi:hypothetical protein
VVEADGRGWFTVPAWFRKIGDWGYGFFERATKHKDPEVNLERAENNLATTIRQFGPDGGPTANARALVADRLEEMDRYTEALLLRQDVLDAQRRRRGDLDPVTLRAELYLGFNLGHTGFYDEAKPLFRHVLEKGPVVLGADHSEVRAARRWLDALD